MTEPQDSWLDTSHGPAQRRRIVHNLTAFDRRAIHDDTVRRAAVAIVLAPVDGIIHYVFTQRSYALRRGAGQYALPGGNVDPGESIIETALRELHEELGVTLDASSLLGMLDDFETRGGHVVTPVVLWSDGALELAINPGEVEAAWLVPVAELDHPEAPRRIAPANGGRPVLRVPVRGEWINPPTAAWLLQFRDVALHGRATRVADVGQPDWTAR
jgi:8-oxo-dGTP pyrophosphatase MutT (NUDIX family)